jgi:hypothetical protein
MLADDSPGLPKPFWAGQVYIDVFLINGSPPHHGCYFEIMSPERTL